MFIKENENWEKINYIYSKNLINFKDITFWWVINLNEFDKNMQFEKNKLYIIFNNDNIAFMFDTKNNLIYIYNKYIIKTIINLKSPFIYKIFLLIKEMKKQ